MDQPFSRVRHATLSELVKFVLISASNFQWSVQGLGMLRLYLGEVGRIHIWDPRLEYPNVSKLHTHSWSLDSTIIAGSIINTRFLQLTNGREKHGRPYARARLVCGMNGGLKEEAPEIVSLLEQPAERYYPGDRYSQLAHEIHYTQAAVPGTVTLMERPYDGDTGEADVFWPIESEWGDAKPRPATPQEIEQVTRLALSNFK